MFQLPEEVKKDIAKYQQSLKEWQAGKISSAKFKGIRVPWGFYSHRGGQVYMGRVRVPAGTITAAQLKALAAAAKKYGKGLLHLTTRQDIQIHNLKIEDSAEIINYLKEFDLSPRGGGGNTVRNITTCVLAGICAKELFDVREQALALTEQLLKEEDSFNLPRKYKITFVGCAEGQAGCLLNDVGFLAKSKDGQLGYQVFVGGGLGASSRIGRELESFVAQEEAGAVAEAVKQVFNSHGNRKNKHHNRLRFLVEELGFAKFVALYKQERRALKKIAWRKITVRERPPQAGQVAKGEGEAYQEFLRYSVRPQKQAGYASVSLRIPRGDIKADQLAALAALAEEFPEIEFRTGQRQNLLLAWVKNQDLFKLFTRLAAVLPDFFYPATLLDVVACKGALTCNIGICNSPGLAEELEKLIKRKFLGAEILKKLDIKLNGCPNACGHHPLGKISLHGLVKKVDNRPVPFYKLFLGGKGRGSEARLAEEIGSLPAKSVPAFLEDFLSRLEAEVKQGRKISDLFVKDAQKLAKEILPDYSQVPSYEQNRDLYIDWGRSEEFSLAGIGPGECGAGVIDMIEADLKEAKQHLGKATFKELYQALVYSARALLIVKGIEPQADSEVLAGFKVSFVEEGVVAYRFKDISEFALTLLKEEVKLTEALAYVKGLYEEVTATYQGMDSNFNFPLREEVKAAAAAVKPLEKQVEPTEALLDLRGVSCPINYVKAKLKMETMQKGERLLLYLDRGEPIQNVPASFKNDGQDVMKIEEKDSYFEVLVRKEV